MRDAAYSRALSEYTDADFTEVKTETLLALCAPAFTESLTMRSQSQRMRSGCTAVRAHLSPFEHLEYLHEKDDHVDIALD